MLGIFFLFMWITDIIVNKIFGEYGNPWLKTVSFIILAFLLNFIMYLLAKRYLKKEREKLWPNKEKK